MSENVVNNGHVNAPSDGVAQGLYENSTVQKGPIGARRALNDGRVFRYGYFVTAVSAGTLAAQDASTSVVSELAATAVRNSAGTAADIASSDNVDTLYFLDTDLLTATNSNDVFAGGYVHHIASAEGGYTYRIKGNTYTAATSVMKVDLYDTIQANISSQNEMAITGNMFNNLKIADGSSSTDNLVVGVPLVDMAATSYGWVQTWGVGTVLADESAGTIAAGYPAALSDSVDGAAHQIGGGAVSSTASWGGETEPILGYFVSAATDGNFTPIFLQISP